jgi:hypothetical protein
MARSARWIAACETGLSGLSFCEAYEQNRQDLSTLAVDHSTVATTLVAWLEAENINDWEGTATELLTLLAQHVDGVVLWGHQFPKAPNKLSAELKRLVPVLRQVGVEVEIRRSKVRRSIAIRKKEGAVTESEKVHNPEDDGKPSLMEITTGRIPFDLPYEVRTNSNGRYVKFCLSKEEVAQLPLSVRMELNNFYRDECWLKLDGAAA